MRVKNLRFFRCIDVFKITISSLPAAAEHLFCSSAAGRHTSIQAPFGGIVWGRARAGFLPRQLLDGTKRMHYASIRAGKRTPRVRFSPGACAPGIRSYQLWLPATCLMVTWRRLKRLAVAIMRIKTASPCSS
jgi:hypothetical protein